MPKQSETAPIVLVTGANGWMGRSAIAVLTERYPQSFQILALTRGSGHTWTDPMVKTVSYEDLKLIDLPIHGIVHTAFKTQSYIQNMDLSQYRAENLETIDWLKAFVENQNLKWAVGISSGAATNYLEKVSVGQTLKPEDIYGELKVLEERVLLSSHIEHVAVGRLWAASGRFMQNFEIYALGQFLENAIKGKEIMVKSATPVFRRYVDVEDFIDVLLNCAWENSRTLLDSGGHLTSIQDLAEEVAKSFRVPGRENIKVRHLNHIGNSDSQNYFPKSNRFDLLMERYGIVSHSIVEQIERTKSAVIARLDNKK